ncbi:MAG: hypothetical protein V1846_05030 [Candidatus Komeilibacteria bacterium]
MSEKMMDLNWGGMLTVRNIERVAALLRTLLVGRRFTFVTAHESSHYRPKVLPGQQLASDSTGDPVQVHYGADRKRAGLIVSDSSGVWDLWTDLLEDSGYDPRSDNPHIRFAPGQVTITHRSGSGHLIYWVAAVEEQDSQVVI